MRVDCDECVFRCDIPFVNQAGCLKNIQRFCGISGIPGKCFDDCTFGVKGESMLYVIFVDRLPETQKRMREAWAAYNDRPIKCRNCTNAADKEG
jgi:hypothetical protein